MYCRSFQNGHEFSFRLNLRPLLRLMPFWFPIAMIAFNCSVSSTMVLAILCIWSFTVRPSLPPDSLYHFQQFLLTKSPSQVEEVPPHLPQLLPVEMGLARLGAHRTRRVSDSHIYGEKRGVGSFQLNFTLHDEMHEVFSVSPEQLRFADFEVGDDFVMGLDCYPDPAASELDWDADPVAGNFRVVAFDSGEVFSDEERVFSFGIDAAVEPLGLLFVGGVEFDALVAPQETLKPVVLVIENLALYTRQPNDLRLDDLLNLRFIHQFPICCFCSSCFREGEGTKSIRPQFIPPERRDLGFLDKGITPYSGTVTVVFSPT